jgi:hypothetical protein
MRGPPSRSAAACPPGRKERKNPVRTGASENGRDLVASKRTLREPRVHGRSQALPEDPVLVGRERDDAAPRRRRPPLDVTEPGSDYGVRPQTETQPYRANATNGKRNAASVMIAVQAHPRATNERSMPSTRRSRRGRPRARTVSTSTRSPSSSRGDHRHGTRADRSRPVRLLPLLTAERPTN